MMTKEDVYIEELERFSTLPSIVKRLQLLLLDEAKKRTDFYTWLDEDKRAEFLLGEVVIHSPARLAHIAILQNLLFIIAGFVKKEKLGFVGTEQALVRMQRSDVMPDLAFWPHEESQHFTPDMKLFPVPSFVVEILSPSTEKYDRGIKMTEYAANGVKEYWLVNPEGKEIEQYERKGEDFKLIKKHTEAEPIHCKVLDGLTIQLAEIFN